MTRWLSDFCWLSPLLFMLVFGAAFGGDNIPSYSIGVVDNDQTEISHAFIYEALPEVPIFNISIFDSETGAREALEQGDLSVCLITPAGFGQQVSAVLQGADGNISLDVIYDESDLQVSQQIISSINSAVRQFGNIEIPVSINAHPINIESDITEMDFIATGIIVFGLLIMIPTAGRIMLRDKESRFIYRLLTTPARPWEFVMGYSLSMVLLSVVQIIFFILLGWLFGMDIVGSLFLAFIIYLLTAIGSIGIGMVVASLSKSENQGEALSWLFSMPLAMVSGVWFSIDAMPSYIRGFANLFPYAHAVTASRAVIIRGAGIGAISGDFIFLICWAVAIFAIGTFLFSRTMKS